MGCYLPRKFHLIELIYTVRDKKGHKKQISTSFPIPIQVSYYHK